MYISNNKVNSGVVDSKDNVLTNSVLSPSAEYTTLWTALQAPGNEIATDLLHPRAVGELSIDNGWLFVFMLESGCRISEALNVGVADILMLGDVVIKGAKGSSDRIVRTRYSQRYFLHCRANIRKPFLHTNYDCFYKSLKRKGLGVRFGNNNNMSVTHYFRHIYALLQKSESVNVELTQRDLGHKSIKSTEAYLKKKRDGKNNK